jgi:Zn-dependent peptidase ImmA (M78 family)
MPASLVKSAWADGFQGIDVLARHFEVSMEAMNIRLRNMGIIDDDQRPIEAYFRQSLFGSPDLDNLPVAA